MQVSLKFISYAKSVVDRLESFRWICFAICCVPLLVQFMIMGSLARFVSPRLWLVFLLQCLALVLLLSQLFKRRRLSWRARRFLDSLDEPRVIDVSETIRSGLHFRTLPALVGLWILIAIVICPFYVHSGSTGLLGYPRSVIENADTAFFAALWAVQATILGVFLVILTFIFQFISLRQAYETSLLPFLAEQVHIKPVILINLFFVLFEMVPLLIGRNRSLLLAKYISVLGLIFGVLSASYLVIRVLDLLRPEMIDDSLMALVRRDLVKELEEEEYLNVSAAILSEECTSWGMEYSSMDLLTGLPAIRSTVTGRILDIDLKRLSRFCRHLKGTLPMGASSPVKARVVVMISDELTRQRNVLARISSIDLSLPNEQLLRRAVKIKQCGES
jgi:hypothetical protein